MKSNGTKFIGQEAEEWEWISFCVIIISLTIKLIQLISLICCGVNTHTTVSLPDPITEASLYFSPFK